MAIQQGNSQVVQQFYPSFIHIASELEIYQMLDLAHHCARQGEENAMYIYRYVVNSLIEDAKVKENIPMIKYVYFTHVPYVEN